MKWSPGGDALAYVCISTEGSPPTLLRVIDSSSKKLAEVAGVAAFHWSPDGSMLALAIEMPSDGYRVDLLSLNDGQLRTTLPEGFALGWMDSDSLLVGLDVQFHELRFTYSVYTVSLSDGSAVPVPHLNDADSLWLSPDGKRAIVTASCPDPATAEGGCLSVYDFAARTATQIPGAYISYPSESVRQGQLSFDPSGMVIHWATLSDTAVIWTARLDGGPAIEIGQIPWGIATPSPEGLVARFDSVPDTRYQPVIVEHLQSGFHANVGPGRLPFAWRLVRSAD
jgi:hypothetical protein